MWQQCASVPETTKTNRIRSICSTVGYPENILFFNKNNAFIIKQEVKIPKFIQVHKLVKIVCVCVYRMPALSQTHTGEYEKERLRVEDAERFRHSLSLGKDRDSFVWGSRQAKAEAEEKRMSLWVTEQLVLGKGT